MMCQPLCLCTHLCVHLQIWHKQFQQSQQLDVSVITRSWLQAGFWTIHCYPELVKHLLQTILNVKGKWRHEQGLLLSSPVALVHSTLDVCCILSPKSYTEDTDTTFVSHCSWESMDWICMMVHCSPGYETQALKTLIELLTTQICNLMQSHKCHGWELLVQWSLQHSIIVLHFLHPVEQSRSQRCLLWVTETSQFKCCRFFKALWDSKLTEYWWIQLFRLLSCMVCFFYMKIGAPKLIHILCKHEPVICV